MSLPRALHPIARRSRGWGAVHRHAVGIVFFLAAWWLRPEFFPINPYPAGHLVTLFALIAIVVWGLRGFPHYRNVFTTRRWQLALLAWLGWAALSQTWSRYPDVSQAAAAQWAFIVAFALAAGGSGLSPRTAAAYLAAGMAVQAVVSIVQVTIQAPIGLAALGEHLMIVSPRRLSVLTAGDLRLMRPYGLTVHPNLVGGALAVGLLALSAWLWSPARQVKWAIFRLATLSFGGWALLITFSRSAWLGLAAGALTVLILGARCGLWRRAVLARGMVWAGLAAVIGGVFLATYGDFVLARAGVGAEDTEAISANSRRVQLEIAWGLFRADPVSGVGIGAFPWEMRDYLWYSGKYPGMSPENVHMVPALIGAELGAAGLLLWLVMFGLWGRAVWRAHLEGNQIGLVAGVVALFIIGLFDHYPIGIWHFRLLWYGLMAVSVGRCRGEIPPDTASDEQTLSAG